MMGFFGIVRRQFIARIDAAGEGGLEYVKYSKR